MKFLSFLIFLQLSLASFSQSRLTLKTSEKSQLKIMRTGTLLVPLKKEISERTVLENLKDIHVKDYNLEIIQSFEKAFHFSEIVYYFEEDLDSILVGENLLKFIFNKTRQPIGSEININSLFYAIVTSNYQKDSDYQKLAYKKKTWKVISEENIKNKNSNREFDKELEAYTRDSKGSQGMVIYKYMDEEVKLSKKRKLSVNFKYFFPFHMRLPFNIKYQRFVEAMEIYYIEKYNKDILNL